MALISKKTFGPTDTVQVDGYSFDSCIFDDCEMVGNMGMSFSFCEFKGRAATWFESWIAPQTYMTVDLEKGGVEFGPAASTKH